MDKGLHSLLIREHLLSLQRKFFIRLIISLNILAVTLYFLTFRLTNALLRYLLFSHDFNNPMKIPFLLISVTLLVNAVKIEAGHITKLRIHPQTGERKILSLYPADLGPKKKILKNIKEFISETDPTGSYHYQEIYSPEAIPKNYQQSVLNFFGHSAEEFPGAEVRPLIKQGPDSNRIILTILGDGYTHEEKEKFFLDANRIVGDLFREVTFKSYLNLFNVYAVYTPSRESGITDIKRVDTVFGLYRAPKGSKRGVMPGNQNTIERALRLASPHTDYPVIIANDDYYGGLGGRYAITTRSPLSGSMVLRHELGHNFSNVGEEYDGGQVYSGANFSRTPKVGWSEWITPNTPGPFRHEALHGNYVWKNLNPGDDITLKFHSPRDLYYQLTISAVGWQSQSDMRVTLNSQSIPISGVLSPDRSFFTTNLIKMNSGDQSLHLKNTSNHPITLAFANGLGFPAHYNFQKNLVSAFSVYADGGLFRGYRPTHDMCLMREMRSKVFCPVDQENIWLRFLDRLNLIEDLEVSAHQVRIKTLAVGEILIKWFQKSRSGWEELPSLRGQKQVELPNGDYLVQTLFYHPEVRKEDSRRADEQTFSIK